MSDAGVEFSLAAPAKLNLGLEVVGRRADGYHDLVTIFQTIALADTLTFAPGERLTLLADPALGGERNLILQAARALAARLDRASGATIRLLKAIPVAAGLGGGSSDAAAALRGLCRLWAVSVAPADLAALATALGADVPFFLRGGTALATGRGEVVTPLPDLAPTWFVTLTPPLTVPPEKTRRLYQALGEGDFTDGDRTWRQAARLRADAGLDPALLVNSFSRPLAALFPALRDWEARLRAAGAPWVVPSGSGPTLFTGVAEEAAAAAIAARLAGSGALVHVARAVGATTIGADRA